ncbi:S8 family serine peptidase [Oceanobacillus massiliensis]|uniref:S8 family serine peptidase n=1 Tax=Oceanobacillus massiliensis TaxID=1465765 RepID=UPI00028827B2|nr:S8 family serine peptidase [Oceanobacillus massiliensis]
MLKRVGTLLLVILLVFSNFSAVSASSATPKLQKKEDLSSEDVKETVDPNDEVRVLVEMEDEAPIKKATKKGVKYDKLAKSEKKSLEKAAKAKQKTVKDKIKDKRIDAEYINEFTAVVNAFSAEVKQGDIEEIKSITDVKGVYIVNEYERPIAEPDMKYSKELVQAQEAWRDYGYKGEGMIVGIIDTGIDPSHRDMVLRDAETAELTEEDANQIISQDALPGQFYSEKVPYGYNYMDGNDEIREIHSEASYHGMHVAGTVGANGDEENGGILGIAPEAQLLALKVFGNDPEMQSTYGDIYIKAIEDAIKLGADVLNMSLGSAAGFVDPESPEQTAVANAVDNGVLMSISAGNSAMFGDGYFYPYASNPDYGVSGSPGVSYDSLQVASFENTYMEVDAVEYTIDGEADIAAYLSASSTHPNDVEQKSFDVIEAGEGYPEDFEGEDATGKYVLIQRGGIAFTEKALNAQNAGAAGVIIYNNTDGIVNMATEAAITIPQLFMLKSDGDALAESIRNGQSVTLEFNGEKTTINNPDAGKMSAFSSWGLTPNLDFKPEITAPGGQILSTLNDNQYGLMSGTSMAAPHVSGGGALVMQRVDEEFGYEGSERVNLTKKLLMNTSEQVEFDGALVSPRRQGAGLMQLHAALSTPVVVTESSTNEAKVALKEITENEVTFELTAENFSDEAAVYEVQANAQTDTPADGGGVMVSAPNLFGATDLGDIATINGEAVSTVEVPANGTASFEVTIDVSEVDAELNSTFTNGYWLEGFVTLTDPTDTNPKLTVPYVGFKGNWDAAPIFDTPMWDPLTFYGMTGIGTSLGEDNYGFLGEDLATGEYDPEKIAFSPNGDGVQDDALLILSFLRNAKEAKFNVLDEDGKVVRTIRLESEIRKDYYDSGLASYYSLDPARAWDGEINGKAAEEGQYYLSVDAVIDYEGAEWQSLELPVLLDVTAPELEATIDPDTDIVTVEAADNEEGSGLASWDVLVDGESVLDAPYVADETEHQLENLEDDQIVSVVAVDYAGNSVEEEAEEPVAEDVTVPDLHLLTPEFLGVETSKKVEFTGYVTDESGVKEVTVDGKQAKLVYNEAEDRYDFSLTVKQKKDGYYFNQIKAVDNAGNETEIGRRYFVDTEKADLSVKAKKKTKEDTINVTAHVKDEFDEISLYVNGNHVYANELSEPYGDNKFNDKIEMELDLEEGKNVFEFKVVDLGGHETIEKVVIEKQKDRGKDKDKEDIGEAIGYFVDKIRYLLTALWSFFG